jgi:hypothetical protein
MSVFQLRTAKASDIQLGAKPAANLLRPTPVVRVPVGQVATLQDGGRSPTRYCCFGQLQSSNIVASLPFFVWGSAQ